MSKRKLDSKDIPQAIAYSEKLAEPVWWVQKADELLTAAHVLESEVIKLWDHYHSASEENAQVPAPLDVHGAYFMLVAYALENLCKAKLIQQHNKQLSNRLITRLPGYLKEHDLLHLVHDIGLSVDLEEEDILARLSRNSVWAARYPVPVGPNALSAIKLYSDGKSYLTAYFHGGDVARINNLTARLKDHIGLACQEGI